MECITLENSSTVPKQIINFLRQFAALFKACFKLNSWKLVTHGVSFIVVLYAT